MKYNILIDKRRKKLGLAKDISTDPATHLCQEQVDEIINEWKEDFVAQDSQQFRINLPEDKYNEQYVVGVSELPDQRKKYKELTGEKKEAVDRWFKSMLTNHFSILNPDVESDGDPLVIADGLRVVEFVLIYGIIGGEFLRPLLSGSN